MTGLGLRDDIRDVAVIAIVTTWLRELDALELYFNEPWYTAVTEWEAATKFEVETDAIPFAKVAVPSSVELSKKTTVPVGAPELDVTVAVNVMSCPKTEGLSDEARVVVVLIAPT